MNLRAPYWVITTLLMLSPSAHAGAEDRHVQVDLTQLPFENLLEMEVSTAAKIARQVSDAPSAVSIVTADDIRAYGYRTLADIIDSMRGLYTTSDRSWAYLGGRGFGRPGDYTGRVLLMIDGYASNDNIYNQIYIDNAGILDTELIERVEYVPGTGSVAYGNNAYFGIINVITKKGRDFGGAQVSGELFSYGGKKGRATYGKQLENGADILFSASWLDRDGQDLFFPEFNNIAHDPNVAVNHGVARNLDYESSKRIFGKLHYENLTVEGGYVDHQEGVPTAAYGVDFNAYNHYWDNNGFISANYDVDFNPELKASTHAYYGNYLDRGAGYYTVGGMWREHNLGQWWGIDEKFVATWFENHKLVFGAEYRDDFQMDMRNPVSASHHQRTTASLYLQDEVTLTDQLRLNIGTRYDYGNDIHGNMSPRVALMFSPTMQTTIKAAYSEAFRMPATYEKYYTDGSQIPNPNLAHEHIATSELVLQHAFSRDTRLIASIYRYNTWSLITNVDFASGYNHYINAGGSHTKGMELELEHNWDSGIRMRGSIAHQLATDENGAWMVNSPRNLGKFNLTFPLFQNTLRTGLEMQYASARRTEADKIAGAYTLANLTFSSIKTIAGFNASFSVRNLFDRHYVAVAPGGFVQDTLQMDGRNFWLQLGYDFK